MRPLLEIVQLSTSHLLKKMIKNAKLEAEYLVAETLGIKRLDLFVQYDRPITENELNQIRVNLEKRAQGMPLSYIIGKHEFLDLQLKVDQRVLIPRPETEVWVERIKEAGPTIWDICTGSGAIGLALKRKFPESDVVLSDIDQGALELAAENALINEVKVKFKLGDLFEPFKGEKADLITINPPYISHNDYLNLEAEVRDHEPKKALVGGATGLEYYERISHELPHFLNPGAEVYLEMGYDQESSVLALFESGPWQKIEVWRDYSGHPRCLFLKFNGISLKIPPSQGELCSER